MQSLVRKMSLELYTSLHISVLSLPRLHNDLDVTEVQAPDASFELRGVAARPQSKAPKESNRPGRRRRIIDSKWSTSPAGEGEARKLISASKHFTSRPARCVSKPEAVTPQPKSSTRRLKHINQARKSAAKLQPVSLALIQKEVADTTKSTEADAFGTDLCTQTLAEACVWKPWKPWKDHIPLIFRPGSP